MLRLSRFSCAATLMLHGVFGAAAHTEQMFDSPALSDAELANARGGFALPSGVQVDFGILMTTSVDGVPLLRTELQVTGNDVTTSVRTPSGDQIIIGGIIVGGSSVRDGTSADVGAVIAHDSQEFGTGATIGGSTLSVDHNGAQIDIANISAKATLGGGVDVSLNGVDTAEASGAQALASAGSSGSASTVTLTDLGLSTTAQLPQLLVQHEIGRQISSLIINTADGRVIDNQLMINLRLGNVEPLALGSLGFRVQSVGMDAAMWRASGG